MKMRLKLQKITNPIKQNYKRVTVVIILLIFFSVSSSFTFKEDSGDLAEELFVEVEGVPLVDSILEELSLEDEEELLEEFDEFHPLYDEGTDKFTLDDIIEENEEFANRDREREVVSEDMTFSEDDWRLILINKHHPIPDDYEFNLGTFASGMKCDERIIEDLLDMMEGAKKDGINLVVRSPYRDSSRQVYLFERKINLYMSRGMSYMDAYKYSSQTVTVPGASEHQVGLAIDITTDLYTSLDAGFADTAGGKWLAEHCSEYGFIIRYPKDKEDITSIRFEPWHFRYVGVEAATIIMDQGISLEEFWEKYLR